MTCTVCDEKLEFEIYNLDQGTNIYHGTFFKLSNNDRVWTPAFYSTDILQALGHILTKFDHLDIKNNLGNSSAVVKQLNDISKCFPLLYTYEVSYEIKLLKLNYPHEYDTFDILFNKGKLLDAIMDTKDADKIIRNFYEQFKKIAIGNVPEIPPKFQTRESCSQFFDKLFDAYMVTCRWTCFGGYGNTPGYTLLSVIDYNTYLANIGLISKGTVVHGIYVESDQDEIILLDNYDCLSTSNISFVLPFQQKYFHVAGAQDYIDKYVNYATEFLKKSEKTVSQDYENKANFINHVLPYAYIGDPKKEEEEKNGGKKWDIDWFFTPCERYDPYEEISTNCAKNLSCRFRKPGNVEKQGGTGDVWGGRYAYIWEDEYMTNCLAEEPSIWKSAKISLGDMKNVNSLRKYIKIIKTKWTESKLQKLSICAVPVSKKETYRQRVGD